MTWNYRIIRSEITDFAGTVHKVHAMHEVYYDEDGKPGSWTANAITLDCYDDFRDMYASIVLMTKAFEKPILLLKEDDNGNEYLIDITEDQPTGDS